MKNKFWNWLKNESSDENELVLDGPISDETWWGDEITPALFKSELKKHVGDVTIWLNSPGGDVFAASQIYTMLRNHKGKITVKIDGIAASAASVIAMAGDETFISPTGMLMIHNPMTMATGNKADMEKAIELLEEVKESIVNAYALKTSLSRNKISKLMDEETWMNAEKALQLGFVDDILFSKKEENKNPFIPEEDEESEEESKETSEEDENSEKEDEDLEDDKPQEKKKSISTSMLYSTSHTRNSFLQKISANSNLKNGIPIEQFEKRLELLKY